MSGDRFRVNLKRILLASLASLTFVFLAFFIPSILGGVLTMSMHPIAIGVGLGFFAVVYSCFVIALWGVPSHLFFLYFKIRAVWAYLISGLVGGPLLLVIVRPFGMDPLETLLKQVALLGGFGLIAAFVFWYVAVRGADSSR